MSRRLRPEGQGVPTSNLQNAPGPARDQTEGAFAMPEAVIVATGRTVEQVTVRRDESANEQAAAPGGPGGTDK